MHNHGGTCQDCRRTLTPQNQQGKHTLSTLCDTCDARDRDNFAYMTGTGHYSQS